MTRLLTILLLCLTTTIYCQVDTTKTVYKNLKIRKDYDIAGYISATTQKGTTEYFHNDQKISKKKYKILNKGCKNIEKCTPCLLKTYNENDTLLYQVVCYTDAYVGQYIEYYKDGKIKLIGHYKENPTDNWDNLCARGFCSVKHGTWTYYNEDGTKSKIEIYKDDVLINK